MRILLAALLFILLSCRTALADVSADCNQLDDIHLSVRACTQIIDGNASGNILTAYNNRGLALAQKGEYARAIADFDQLIRVNPNVAILYVNRANAYSKKGDGDNAIDNFTQALRLEPDPFGYNARGLEFYKKRDYDRAIADYTQAIRLNSGLAAAYNNRALAYDAKHDYDAALADFTQAIRLDPKQPETFYLRGLVYADRGSDHNAIDDFTQAIRIDANFFDAYINRGLVYYKKVDYDRAIADFDSAIRLNPTNAIGYLSRGNAYFFRGDLTRGDRASAIADYDTAIRLDPAQAVSYNSRGVAHGSEGNHERAIADYNQAIQINPNEAVYYVNRATAYENRQDYERAIADYSLAIRLDAKFVLAYNRRAKARENKGDIDGAIVDYSQVLSLAPDSADIYSSRGNAFYTKGDYERAIADYSKVVSLRPDSFATYNSRGAAYHNAGDYEHAIADFSQAIKRNPRDAVIFGNRAQSHFGKGDNDRAIADADQAISLKSDAARLFYIKCGAHSDKDDEARASEACVRALAIDPSLPDKSLHRGWAYAKERRAHARLASGDKEGALGDFNAALRVKSDSVGSIWGCAQIYESQGLRKLAATYLRRASGLPAVGSRNIDFQRKARERLAALTLSAIPPSPAQSSGASMTVFDLEEAAIRAVEGVGTIGEVHVGASNGAPILVIEEDHLSRVGQLQIAVMLNRLYRHHGLKRIGLEGMTKPVGRLDATWFHRSTSDVPARDDVAARMLGEGEISSAELMALIYSDVEVFGTETRNEYDATPDFINEWAPITAYFVHIAKTSMNKQDAWTIDRLMRENKTDEAREFAIKRDAWIRQRYEQLTAGSAESSIASLRAIIQKARDVGAPIDEPSKKAMQYLLTFWEVAELRSNTMATKVIAVSKNGRTGPVALIIGAAHTEGVASILKAQGLQFAVLTPNAFGLAEANVTIDQFRRKNKQYWARISRGTIGAVLNQNRKEPPKIETPTAKSYASMYLASIIIARAARDGKKIPDDVVKDLASLPGLVIDWGSFLREGLDVIFSATLTAPDGRATEVWSRVGTVALDSSDSSLEEKLGQAIAAIKQFPPDKALSATNGEGPGDYLVNGVGGEPVVVQRLTPGVVAAFGATKEPVMAIGPLTAARLRPSHRVLVPSKGSLRGPLANAGPNADDDQVRALARQNDAALILSKHGLDIEQLRERGTPGGNPDLKINGALADVFAPITANPDNIALTVEKKVTLQAAIVVIHLADSPVTPAEIIDRLQERHIDVKLVYFIKDGILSIYEAR